MKCRRTAVATFGHQSLPLTLFPYQIKTVTYNIVISRELRLGQIKPRYTGTYQYDLTPDPSDSTRDLHVLLIDLANAFGSVLNNFLCESFNSFHIPSSIHIPSYFKDLQLCLTTLKLTTSWQPVEGGIIACCAIPRWPS